MDVLFGDTGSGLDMGHSVLILRVGQPGNCVCGYRNMEHLQISISLISGNNLFAPERVFSKFIETIATNYLYLKLILAILSTHFPKLITYKI